MGEHTVKGVDGKDRSLCNHIREEGIKLISNLVRTKLIMDEIPGDRAKFDWMESQLLPLVSQIVELRKLIADSARGLQDEPHCDFVRRYNALYDVLESELQKIRAHRFAGKAMQFVGIRSIADLPQVLQSKLWNGLRKIMRVANVGRILYEIPPDEVFVTKIVEAILLAQPDKMTHPLLKARQREKRFFQYITDLLSSHTTPKAETYTTVDVSKVEQTVALRGTKRTIDQVE